MDNSHYVRSVNLNIFQWNARSIRNKLRAFEHLLLQEKVHIAMVSETWLVPDIHIKLKDYAVFRRDRDEEYGGIALICHKSIQTKLVPIDITSVGIEIIKIQLFNCNELKYITGIYCPADISTTDADWNRIFSLSQHNTLLLGDFNAHHATWSCKTDTRGRQIFRSLEDNENVILLNNGSRTRFQIVEGILRESSPDLSFVSSNIALNFVWSVTSESLGSDHRIIKISTIISTTLKPIKKRNFKCADWNNYKILLNELFEEFIVSEDLQNSYDMFLEHLNKAADRYIPLVKFCQNPEGKFRPKPGWSPQLSHAVAKRRLALANLRRNPTPTNFNNYRDRIHDAQRLIRESGNESWQNFCAGCDEATSDSDMWRRMRWMKGYRSRNVYVDDLKANNLLHSLTPDFVCSNRPDFISNNNKLELPILLHELEKSIKLSDSAPGYDDISFSMIKHLPLKAKSVLLELYNKFLLRGFVPKQWRTVRVVPIPKPGRDPESLSALRPISLISCVCKIFHSIINKRIEWYLERKKILSNEVVGFRKSRSCIDSLSRFVTRTQIGFCENKATIACFLDIENAYNNIDVSVVLTILDSIGVGSKLCLYLWEFLRERHLVIKVNGNNIIRHAGRGLAQGDPLSPLLFNVATFQICKDLSQVHVSQYADDFLIYACDKHIEAIVVNLQNTLDSVVSRLGDLGLDISDTKSKACMFSKGFRRTQINLKINEVNLETVDAIKYLGVWLDRSLKWTKHVNEIHNTTYKFLKIFKVLAGSGWGVHPKHLRRLYISIIRSRLDYACFLYDDCCISRLNNLDSIQNQCMRIVGGFIKTTPIHAMESELSLQPLHIRRIYLAGKFWLKSKSFEDSYTIINLVKDLSLKLTFWTRRRKPLLTEIYNQLQNVRVGFSKQLEMFSLDTWLSYVDVNSFIISNIDCMDQPKHKYNPVTLKNKCNLYLSQKYDGFYAIFTDGSKDQTGSGSAFFDPQNNSYMKFKVETYLSIMYLELIAISESISYIQSIDCNKFVILTDSKSALQHIARCSSTFRGLPIAYQIIELVQKLLLDNKVVVFQWIPSHVGLLNNEKVDLLAKQASCDGIPLNVTPFFTDCYHIIKEKSQQLWKEYFDLRSREIGIWYRTIQSEPFYNVSWIDNCNYSRNVCVTALRLRSGHIPLNKFAHLMQKVISPNCDRCGVPEDVFHVLMECARNEILRKRLFKRTTLVGECNSALAYPFSETAKILYKLYQFCLAHRIV